MKSEIAVLGIVIGTIILLVMMHKNSAGPHDPMVIWMALVIFVACLALSVVFIIAYRDNKRKNKDW